jgi:hypothetical protein
VGRGRLFLRTFIVPLAVAVLEMGRGRLVLIELGVPDRVAGGRGRLVRIVPLASAVYEMGRGRLVLIELGVPEPVAVGRGRLVRTVVQDGGVAIVSIVTVDMGRGRLVPVSIVVEVTVVSVVAFVIVAVIPVAVVAGAVAIVIRGIHVDR